MAIKPPERVASAIGNGKTFAYQDSEGGGATRTTEVTVQAGDVLVVHLMGEWASSTPWVAPTCSGGGLTWTTQMAIPPSAASTNLCLHYVFTAVATEAATFTITTEWKNSASGSSFNARFTVWRGSAGVGNIGLGNNAEGTNTPAEATATYSEHSALDCSNADWQATAGTITWNTINGEAGNKVDSYQGGSDYNALTAYYLDIGAGGSTKVTETTSGGSQRYSMCVVEILGEEETPETPQELVPDEDIETTGWA